MTALQTVLTAAAPGSVVNLDPAVVYTGPATLHKQLYLAGHDAVYTGRLVLAKDAAGTVIDALDHQHHVATGETTSLVLNAADVVLRNYTLTNFNGCIGINATLYNGGQADRLLIENTYVHACGVPGSNKDHGIYLARGDDIVLRGVTVTNCAARGLQLYPAPQRVTAIDCVFTGCAQGVQVSGEGGEVADDVTLLRCEFSGNRASDCQAWWDPNTPQRPTRILLVESPTAKLNVHPIYRRFA